MTEETRQELEESTRQFEKPSGIIETMKSRINDAWEGIKHYAAHPQDLIFNDYTTGAAADVRRRLVEEAAYGKTVDDTVTRQSYGEFKRNAVEGEETGPRWKTDKEFEAWFDAKMAQHNPDYSPDKFYGRDQDQQQNQDQGKSRGMER
jgi:hypothetical protein